MERHCTTKSNRNVPYNSPTALQKQYHAKPNTWALSACTSATTASIMEDGISTNKLLCTQACVERWKSLLQPYKAASMLECKLTSAEEGSYFWTPLHHCGNHFAFAMEQIKNLVPFGLSTISLPFLPPPIAGFSHIVTNTRSGRQLEVYHRQNIYIWPTRPNLIHWARGMRRSWRATITITNKTKLPDLGETYVPTQTALHWPC